MSFIQIFNLRRKDSAPTDQSIGCATRYTGAADQWLAPFLAMHLTL